MGTYNAGLKGDCHSWEGTGRMLEITVSVNKVKSWLEEDKEPSESNENEERECGQNEKMMKVMERRCCKPKHPV